MNKNLLLTICLLVVAIIGFGCVSAADANNNTITDAPTHAVEQQNTNMIKECEVNTQKAVKENVENNNETVNDNTSASKIIVSENVTVQDGKTNSMDASANNTPQLNITGPKINGSTLDIKGPKITGDGPIITMSQMDKDIYHFAKVFMNNPHWDTYDCFDYVNLHTSYNIHEVSIIVAKAHNIALHKYQGKEIMVLGWEITPESVEYKVKKFHNWN